MQSIPAWLGYGKGQGDKGPQSLPFFPQGYLTLSHHGLLPSLTGSVSIRHPTLPAHSPSLQPGSSYCKVPLCPSSPRLPSCCTVCRDPVRILQRDAAPVSNRSCGLPVCACLRHCSGVLLCASPA